MLFLNSYITYSVDTVLKIKVNFNLKLAICAQTQPVSAVALVTSQRLRTRCRDSCINVTTASCGGAVRYAAATRYVRHCRAGQLPSTLTQSLWQRRRLLYDTREPAALRGLFAQSKPRVGLHSVPYSGKIGITNKYGVWGFMEFLVDWNNKRFENFFVINFVLTLLVCFW